VGNLFKKSGGQILNYVKDYNINLNDVYNKYKLSDIQNKIIIGSMLGDGCVTKKKDANYYWFSISHAENQKEYLKFKFEYMKNLCNMKDIVEKPVKKEWGSYNKQKLFWFYTRSLPQFSAYGKMNIYEALNSLDEESFAIWLMDDGRLYDKYYSIGMRKHGMEGLNYAIEILENKFSIQSDVDWSNKSEGLIKGLRFNSFNSQKVNEILNTNLFSENLKHSMAYKFIRY
jgi:hypothetical protein